MKQKLAEVTSDRNFKCSCNSTETVELQTAFKFSVRLCVVLAGSP